VCREIRSAPASAGTAVVVLAGGDAEEHARAVRAGASDVLAKPISRLALVESVQRFLCDGWPRGLPRAPLDAPVQVRAAGASRWATARNVSRGGMFLEGESLPADPGELALEFALPDGPRRLAPTAQVVWRRSPRGDRPGAGVRFVALDRESAHRLDAFVHEHSAPAEGPAALGGTRP
jgi:DNA-binding response OmpR family regulator